MKKYIALVLMLAMMVATSSCDKQLEIIPKGQSTLTNLDDLETLLNQIYTIYPAPHELDILAGVQIKSYPYLPQQFTETNTINYALLTGNEEIDRANLTEKSDSENIYQKIYKFISYSNIVIAYAPDASGDDATRQRLIAEAKVLRAWFHFLAVNIFAEQYDEASAAAKGGIPYVDNTVNTEQKTKLSLAAVYDRILSDCSDDVIQALRPGTVKTVYRFGRDFGYGVRARVLFQMKRYDEALDYANKALSVNDAIEDRSCVMSDELWLPKYDADNNYLLIHNDATNLGDMYSTAITPEVVGMFEDGDFVKTFIDYTAILMNPDQQVENGWSTKYNDPEFPDQLMFLGGDTRFNTWGLRAESMYYIAAECLIRSGHISEGLSKIDAVRLKRIYAPQLYSALTDLTEEEAMEIYQRCRIVEFINTFENFCDRKRWNTEDKYRKTIVHDLQKFGSFSIAPDSKLWVFPFPIKARNMNSSLTNNY